MASMGVYVTSVIRYSVGDSFQNVVNTRIGCQLNAAEHCYRY